MSRHRYPVEISRAFERTTVKKLDAALVSSKEPDDNEANKVRDSMKQEKGKGGKPFESIKNVGDGTRAKQATLKSVLGEALGYGPALSEHIILDAGLPPNTKVSKDNKLDGDKLHDLALAVAKFEDWLHDVISGGKVPEGYILMQKKTSGKDGVPSEAESNTQVITVIL